MARTGLGWRLRRARARASAAAAFLASGRIVALDTPRELKLRYGERTAVVLLDSREEHRLRLDDPADAARLEQWMAEGKVLTVHSQEGTLEDVFVNLAGRPL